MPAEPSTDRSAGHVFQAGRKLDHYQIIRLIGRGGMGEVYLARDTQLGRRVALKVIRASALGDQAAAGRFVQEARVTARFNHPNIVTVYGVGEVEGSPYVALEYLEGQDLHERLGEQPPSVAEGLRIARSIADALTEAHDNGVLHRDLKPDNVLMARDGRLRVLDFGLAKLVGDPLARARKDAPPTDRDAPLTQTGASFFDTLVESQGEGIRGTPLYMAPEQWAAADLTAATDIFAFGLVMHEIFTGRHPLVGLEFIELVNRLMDPNPLPSLESASGLPEALVTLVDRCVDKDPARRPTARSLAHELGELMARDRPARSEDNPFRGLLPFTERNADAYYGREAEVAAFVERLRVEPVLPVAGPSGAGKSSFVAAGVVPRIKEQGRWLVVRVRPGRHPFGALAMRLVTRRGSDSVPFALLDQTRRVDEDLAAERATRPVEDTGGHHPMDQGDSLLGADAAERLAAELRESPARLALRLAQLAERELAKVLLFVDQLEELYSLVEDGEERRAFMKAICSAADDPEGPVRVVFTLRDDFLGRLAEGPEARQALGRITVLRSPEPDALGEILRKPVADRGYSFEDDGLVSEMIAAVRFEAAALPLLQFAGQRLWEQRDRERRVLRRATHDAMGGVAGALVQHTEQVLEGLSAEQANVARSLLLRLVTPESTRRVVPRRELLDGLGDDAPDVLDRLTEARVLLVRKGRSGAELELAHEALISVWDRFARWIEESREERLFVSELEQAAMLWEKRGRREEEVWTGDALRDARRTAARITDLAEPLQRFLDAGAALAGKRRRQRRLAYGLGLVGLAAVAIAAIVFSIVIDRQRRLAEAHKNRAKTEEKVANEQRDRAVVARAAALAESARAAVLRGAYVEARAKIRAALALNDSVLARALWWRLQRDPLQWRKEIAVGSASVSFSPDGRTLAAAVLDGSIHLIDTTTLETRFLRGPDKHLFSVAFGNDNNTLVSGGRSGAVTLWDIKNHRFHVMGKHQAAVRSVHVHPGGRLAVSGSSDKTVRLWDLRTRKQVHVWTPGNSYVSRVRFSPDGRRIAATHFQHVTNVWDVRSRKRIRQLKGHTNVVKSVAWSPDSKRLATGATDKTIRLWEVESGRLLYRLLKTPGDAYSLHWAPDGQLLASAHTDGKVRLWNTTTGRLHRALNAQPEGAYSVAYSRDGRLLASSGTTPEVRVWRAASTRAQKQLPGHNRPVFGLVFDPRGRFIATSGADRKIRLWHPRTGHVLRVIDGHEKPVRDLALSPSGRHLVSASWDRTVRTWNMDDQYDGHNFNIRTGRMSAVDFSPDGKLLAFGGFSSIIYVIKTPKRRPHFILKGHTAQLEVVRFSPDSRLLAAAGADRTLRLYDMRTGRLRQTIKGFISHLRGVVFTQDGKSLFLSSDSGRVYQVDVATGKHRSLGRFGEHAFMIDLHPDGHTLAVPCSGGTTWLVDLKTGKRRALRGHQGDANRARFDKTGKRLATVGDDGSLQVWSTDRATPLWRGTLLSPSTRELYSHRGIEYLGTGTPPRTRKTRWRQAVRLRARMADETPRGGHLCLLTHDGRLEHWNMARDRRLFSHPMDGATELLALPGRCVTLSAGVLRLHHKRGPPKVLAKRISAMGRSGDTVLAGQDARVLLFDPDGERVGKPLTAVRGISALRGIGDLIVVGYRDGSMQRLHRRAGKERTSISFEGVPSSRVTRLHAGPKSTLIAGFANGMLGLWSLRNGVLLARTQMHGAVNHIVIAGGRVLAASKLGQHITLDLRILEQPYCEVLRDIWKHVRVLWQDGLPVEAAPQPDHRCRTNP